jgi:hypothetical protein
MMMEDIELDFGYHWSAGKENPRISMAKNR